MIAPGLKSLARLALGYNRKPSYLILFVTGRCEARCGHCFFWPALNTGIPELTVAQIDELGKHLGPLVQLTLTGGSPELRDDLADIASALQRRCSPLNTTLCSNGNHPAKLYLDVCRILNGRPGCRLTVDISLDAVGPAHDQLRGIDGLFDRVVESYRLLDPLRRRYRGLRLGCGLCVSGLNKESAEASARWAMEHLPLDNFTPILVRGVPRNRGAAATDSSVFMNIADDVEQRLARGSFRGYASFPGIVNRKDVIQKRLIHAIYTTGRSPIRCSAARETAVVYPDGTVAGCELRDEVLGFLPDVGMDIGRIWKSASAHEFRRSIRKRQCACWHQCFLSPTIVKSPGLWLAPGRVLHA